MNAPQRFRKRPVEIEAMQYRPDLCNCAAVAAFAGDAYEPAGCDDGDAHAGDDWFISTLEGEMQVRPGDWVIRGVAGELYPCKPDIFAATYTAVDPLDEVHQIEFRDDGWTILHTLAERIDGSLFDCPLSNWTHGDPGERGRFVLHDSGTLGRRIDAHGA